MLVVDQGMRVRVGNKGGAGCSGDGGYRGTPQSLM